MKHWSEALLALDWLAADTWEKIKVGDRARMKFREDSITDHNLFQLMRTLSPLFSIYRYNQVEEAESGADLEWWIGDPAYGWFALRMQAKRCHGKTYPYLDHPGSQADDYQYDTLIRGCESTTAIYPVHLFYNGWWRGDFADQVEQRIRASRWWTPGHSIPDWGCALLSTYTVRDLHGLRKKDRSSVLRYIGESTPWSEIFFYAINRSALTGSAAAAAHDFVREAFGPPDSVLDDAAGRAGPGPRSDLPEYAEAVRAGYAEESAVNYVRGPARTVMVTQFAAEPLG